VGSRFLASKKLKAPIYNETPEEKQPHFSLNRDRTNGFAFIRERLKKD
jgi:hypothetical protein